MASISKQKEKITEYKLTKVSIDDLKFDESNPNKMTTEQEQSLTNAIERFGFLVPIIINENNEIADGEHRALVYKNMGIKQIPCYVVKDINDDIERRLLRQTMNKLRGTHDKTLDANEMTQIFEHGKFSDLMVLIAKNHAELSDEIMRHSTTADKQMLDILFGEDSGLRGTNSLAMRFGVPPFSVLDATTGTWQKRKDLWYQWGLKSESGREHLRYFNTRLSKSSRLSSISLFDPVLAEISYRWFTPKPHSKIIDPFSGGIVRGLIASFLGHEYHGIDIRQEQIDANEKGWLEINDRMPKTSIHKPSWYVGDAADLDTIIKEKDFDMLLTSPPYFQQEKYSNLENDLNNLSLDQFFDKISVTIERCCNLLKKGSFAVWNTTNTRDPNTGKITNITHHVIDQFLKNGLFLLNDLILVRPATGLQIMAPRHFIAKRTVGNRHEHVFVFYKGNDRSEVPKLDLSIVDIPQDENIDDGR